MALAAGAVPASTLAQGADDLLGLSIEELGTIQVTSVSRREESLNDAPASVHVITRDQIRRSGVTSIPDALRLAPGVEVARNSSSSWTISMRGFSNDLSNKLLVLIDGRSVYSPLYAGVFWDVQDTLLEDIDRIEVIAGPGGTLWGANAVNGVINIITRSAWDTEGGLLQLGGGNELENRVGLRYGRRIGDNVAARVYVKNFDRDASKTLAGEDAFDAWDMSQAGFRLDWELSPSDTLTVQGDIYSGEESALVRGDFTLGTFPLENLPDEIDLGGSNVLARWQRQLPEGANLSLQMYYDRTERNIPGTYDESRDTVDVDFQHNLRLFGRHDLIWGADLRATRDDLESTTFATFEPASRDDTTYSVFIQDKVNLRNRRLFLTVGTKLEHNDYTGFEYQPNVRLSWLPTERQTFWSAVSRAVRIPARLNEDLELTAPVRIPGLDLPLYVNVRGSDDFESEELLAYEVGYRTRIRDNLSFDVVLFDHEYDKLLTQEASAPAVVSGPPPYILLPVDQHNGMRGDTYGGTLAATWQPIQRWQLRFQYSHLEFDLGLTPDSADLNALNVAGNSPEQQLAIYSYVELPYDLSLFTGVRHVDELPNQNVPSYLSVDLSLDWRPMARITASITVQNLNDERRLEFGEGNLIERSAFMNLNWTF